MKKPMLPQDNPPAPDPQDEFNPQRPPSTLEEIRKRMREKFEFRIDPDDPTNVQWQQRAASRGWTTFNTYEDAEAAASVVKENALDG